MREYYKQFKRWWLKTRILPIHCLVLYLGGMCTFFPQKSEAPALVGPLGIIILGLWIFGMPLALMMDERNRSSTAKLEAEG